jgi:Zn-dependent M28 family amino/carboxypeptidase
MLYILRESWNTNAKKISLDIKSVFNTTHQTQNIIGVLNGSQQPDSFIVFSAHYDHLGRMGKKTYFPGANDNASGIAMLLNLAKFFSGSPSKYTIMFIAFAGEEAGLIGSEYFVTNPLMELSRIKFLINLDLAGTGDDGVMVVNGEVFKKEYERMKSINDSLQLLKAIGMRGKARNSDHFWFTEKGVPSFFIYTLGGISAYHDIYDKAETLPLTEFNNFFVLLREFIKSF